MDLILKGLDLPLIGEHYDVWHGGEIWRVNSAGNAELVGTAERIEVPPERLIARIEIPPETLSDAISRALEKHAGKIMAVDPGAEAVTLDGWRSFPEHMPPEDETVWVWIDGCAEKGYYSHGSWYYALTGVMCMVYNGPILATHWMPIQPPPTKPKGVKG